MNAFSEDYPAQQLKSIQWFTRYWSTNNRPSSACGHTQRVCDQAARSQLPNLAPSLLRKLSCIGLKKTGGHSKVAFQFKGCCSAENVRMAELTENQRNGGERGQLDSRGLPTAGRTSPVAYPSDPIFGNQISPDRILFSSEPRLHLPLRVFPSGTWTGYKVDLT